MGGILNPLYTAVSWVMITFHDLLAFTNNEDLQWSVGIIALVIVIRIILIPLFVKQIKSQRAYHPQNQTHRAYLGLRWAVEKQR